MLQPDSRRPIIALFILLILFFSCQPKETPPRDKIDPEVLLSWNKTIMDLAIGHDGLMTLNGVRTQAMVSVAAHNILNAITPVYEFYEFSGEQPEAIPNVSIAQAAFEITAKRFPSEQETLVAMLNNILVKYPPGEIRDLSIQLGKDAAQQMLQLRKNDNWATYVEYTWQAPAPGVYAGFHEHSRTPEGFVFATGRSKAKPFLLKSQNQFRSPPPPDLNSENYTKAFNEVKELGSTNSATRTDDQTHAAIWWKDYAENSHNRLARKLIKKEGLDLWKAARALALLNMTIYDAYVNVFDNAFHFNHWRPFTAIRQADNDENPNTSADKNWNNLHQYTDAFPSYPSAHGTVSSAAMNILSNVLGTGDQYVFTMTTERVNLTKPSSETIIVNPPDRSFNSFSEAGLEASMSGIYQGIHFRYDSEEGHRLGNKIGDYVTANFLRPLY